MMVIADRFGSVLHRVAELPGHADFNLVTNFTHLFDSSSNRFITGRFSVEDQAHSSGFTWIHLSTDFFEQEKAEEPLGRH